MYADLCTLFVQSLICTLPDPYDVTQENYGDKGFVAFRVNGAGFQGWGMGAYSFFSDYTVTVANGMATPPDAVVINPLTVWLGKNGGDQPRLEQQRGRS